MPAVTHDNTNFKFKPYLSFHGKADVTLGIDHFWLDKCVAFILYGQRLALLLLWGLNWPDVMMSNLTFVYGILLDFSAHTDVTAALGGNTFFKGCGAVCMTFWPLICLPVLFLWAGISVHQTLPLYYSRNIERVLWTVVRVGLLPFVNTLVRYFILGSDGNTKNTTTTWRTPNSEIGSLMLLVTLSLFFLFGYQRSSRCVLFKTTVRHEAFIRARELEYLLRFSTTYRNDRMWMISSYTYHAWFWSLARAAVDVFFLFVIYFVPVKSGIIIGNIILGANFFYGALFISLYRCDSTNWMENVFNGALTTFAIFGALRAYGTQTTWLVNTRLDYFLISIHAFAFFIGVFIMIFCFWSSHRMGVLPLADQRANEKWKRIFGAAHKGGWVQMEKVELTQAPGTVDPNSTDLKGSFRKKPSSRHVDTRGGTVSKDDETLDSFYLPKESKYFSLDCESSHVWPVNNVLINELLRRNQDDHLIDLLRASRRMLDRISTLSNSAVLIPIDELKSNITRLQQCVRFCKRQRVTHHMNAIHPLQGIFEDMIEQFVFELRIFNGRSVTVGHNAKKMIEVSRVLRKRMLLRDKALALVSPLMRRILIKLLALRLFIQLIEERPAHLMRDADDMDDPNAPRNKDDEGFGERDDKHSSDDDDGAVGEVGEIHPLMFEANSQMTTRQSTAHGRHDIDPFADDAAVEDPFADDEAGRHPAGPLEQAKSRDMDEVIVRGRDDDAEDENDHDIARLLAEGAKKITSSKTKEAKKDQ